MITIKRKLCTLLVLVVLVCSILSSVGAGYSYVAETVNSGNTSVSEYVVLSQTNYTLVDGVSSGFNTVVQRIPTTVSVTSEDGASNTVITLTIAGSDKSFISNNDKVDIWVKAKDGTWAKILLWNINKKGHGTKNSAEITVTTGGTKTNPSTMNMNPDTGTDYVITVTVTGMESYKTTTATLSRTIYSMEGDIDYLGKFGNDRISGRVIGSDTLRADRYPSDEPVLVTLSCTGFTTPDKWRFVVKVTLHEGETPGGSWDNSSQYATYISSWSYSANDGIKLSDGRVYDIELYFAGYDGNSGEYAFASKPPLTNSGSGNLINNGSITFTFNSS